MMSVACKSLVETIAVQITGSVFKLFRRSKNYLYRSLSHLKDLGRVLGQMLLLEGVFGGERRETGVGLPNAAIPQITSLICGRVADHQ
jgi:hypothetical protein